MKIMKRTTAWLMTILLIMSILPSSLMLTAFASEFVDFPTGWSAEAVQAAVDNGLLQGKGNGKLEPQAKLTRAEAAAVINRAFGSTVKADISSFTDVSPSDWYYEEFAKAVNMKTFVGDGETHLNPNSNITREELFTVFARALVLSDYDTEVLNKFSDSADISDYAKPYLASLVKNEYVNGNADGTLNPKGLITREEFAQMMHNTFKTYISESGTVTSVNSQDSVMIRVPDVTLKDVTIEKDLVLGDGVGTGDVTLENVTVKGRILCRGGEGYVDLVDTTVGDKVVVYDVNGTVNFHNYETEEPFKDHVQHTPATFLQKRTTTGGGGGGGSSSSYKYYDVEVYFQNDTDVPGGERTYSYNSVYDMSVKGRRNSTITLTWEDIDELYENTINWDSIKAKYELDTTNSILTGENDGSLVLKVYLNLKTVTLTYDGNDYIYFVGDTVGTNDFISNLLDTYTPPAGYTHVWNTKEDGTGDEITKDTVINVPTTLYPVLTPITYTIVYESNGGSQVSNGEYNVETDTFELPVPTKDGYFFAGWYENEDLSGDRVKKIEKGTTGDKKFYAAWADDELAFVATVSGDTVTVDVTLTNIPSDINDLASIDIEYSYDVDKLNYVGTESKIGDTLAASAGEIAWLGGAALSELPEDNVLFTITFTKKSSAYGIAEFEFVSSELCDTDMNISAAYAETDDFVDFGEDPGPDVTDAILKFDASLDGNVVTVKAILNKIPDDINDLASIDINYTFDSAMLAYKETVSAIGDTLAASANNIAWNGVTPLTEIPADGVLFTITFDVLPGATGTTTIAFGDVELMDSDYNESTAYTKVNGEVEFIEDPAILRFDASLNGNVVTVKAILNKIPDDINDLASIDINYTFDETKLAYKETVSAIGDTLAASANNIAWNGVTALTEIPADGVLFTITFDVLSGAKGTTTIAFGDVELMDSDYNVSTNYTKVDGDVELIEDSAILRFDAALEGDVVTVKAILNRIPDDINDLASIDIDYTFDETKLAYKETVSAIGDTLAASANNIAWNGVAPLAEIPADGVLFTITFDVLPGATGITTIGFGDVELMDSDYNVSANYTKVDGDVDLSEASATIKFKAELDSANNIVTVKAILTRIPDDINDLASIDIDYTFDNTMLAYKETVSAIGDTLAASANNIAWNGVTPLTEIPADGVLFTITFDVLPGATGTTTIAFADVELMDSDYNVSTDYTKKNDEVNFGESSLYTVKIYKGVEKDTNLKDTIENVAAGTYLTEDQVYAKLGRPEVYQKAGYTDSDGEVHYIVPTLMYNNKGVWEEFDIANTPVNQNLVLCLLSKTLSVTITSDRTIKGYNIPEIPLEIPYDSESAVGESILDAMTISQKIFNNILDSLEEEKNVDLYAKLVEKLSEKGLADANGNIIPKKISLEMVDFIHVDEIEGEIDSYVEEGLLDDEFIVMLLENDSLMSLVSLNSQEQEAVNAFINNENRDLLRDDIVSRIEEAFEAYKLTHHHTQLIENYKNGHADIIVNANNVISARAIAVAVDSYTYEKIKNDFIDPKYYRFIDVIGDDVISEYVEEATTAFVEGLNEACDKVDADVANGILDSEYKHPASLSADVDLVGDILYHIYDKSMNKLKAKLLSEPAIRYDQNTDLQELVNANLLDEIFFDKTTGADGKTVYSIKRDIAGMYDVVLEKTILAHDALIWYNQLDDSEVDAMTSGAAAILAGYANKLNGMVMDYIENGELPGGLTLDEILGFNGKIEEFYNKYEDKIEKALEKYEQYMDRDYAVIFDKLATGSIVANGEAFKLTDIVIENKVFDIDELFDVILNGQNFADNDKVQKVVSKIESAKYTPTADDSVYYIDAYKATLNNREILGISTGNTTVDVKRYLQ